MITSAPGRVWKRLREIPELGRIGILTADNHPDMPGKSLSIALLFIPLCLSGQSRMDSLKNDAANQENDTLRYGTYMHVARTYYNMADYEGGIAFLKNCEAEARQNNPDNSSAMYDRSMEYLGEFFYFESIMYYSMSQYDKALAPLDSCRAAFGSVDSKPGIAKAYNLAGALFQYQSQFDSAIVAYEMAYLVAAEVPDSSLMVKTVNNRAGILKHQQKFDQAIALYQEVKRIGTALQDKNTIGDAHKGLADVYYFTSRYYQALDQYGKALQLFEETNDNRGISNVISNMAIIYKEQGEYDAALENYRRSLELSRQRKFQKGIAEDHLSIGAVYGEMEMPDSALYYYRRALAINRAIDYKPGLAMSYANIGNKLVEKDSLGEGIAFMQRSTELYRQIKDEYNLINVLSMLAHAQLQSGDIRNAEQHVDDAYTMSVDLDIPEGIRRSAEVYADVLKAKGSYRRALDFLELSKSMQDSLRNEELRDASIRTDLQLEYNKKVMQDSIHNAQERFAKELEFRESLNKEKRKRNLLVFLVIGVIVLAIGFYSRIRFITRSRKLLQKEKDRSDELLLNILPFEVAEELKIKGESEARAFDNVTVLFTDFMEFTEKAESLTAKELVDEINVCFRAFDQIIQDHNVEKIKTIGDAYMAAGGLHQPRVSEPVDVVSAAIEMQQFMIDRKNQREANGLPYFEMRVGIHTGPVVAGIVGVKKFQYDIWGDTVNTASRMESHGEVGRVNISDATYALLRDNPRFRFESRGNIQVKGKGEMGMWYVQLNA